MNCNLCASPSTEMIAHAVVAPWITAIISNSRKPIFSNLYRCLDCNFQFFGYRYTQDEMTSLYSNYRGESYFRQRNSYEPWFSRETMNNWKPSENPSAVESRRVYMSSFFEANGIELHSISDVLDFGGDLGQFFPQEVGGKKYLVDPANFEEKSDGIVRVSSIDSLFNTCGLVLNCHTLEHIPNLKTTVSGLVPVLREKGYIYIEVPMDFFSVSRFHKHDLYLRILKFAANKKKVFIALDFLTGLHRMIFHKVPFWGIVKQSEHINYFNKESLPKLLDSTSLELISVSEPDFSFGQGRIKLGRISLIARKMHS